MLPSILIAGTEFRYLLFPFYIFGLANTIPNVIAYDFTIFNSFYFSNFLFYIVHQSLNGFALSSRAVGRSQSLQSLINIQLAYTFTNYVKYYYDYQIIIMVGPENE